MIFDSDHITLKLMEAKKGNIRVSLPTSVNFTVNKK